MVQNLTCIILDTTCRLADDLLQCRLLETAARQQSIQVIHISRQVLPVMETYRLTADYWLKSLCCIRQHH